jgi:hypothetical protein
MNLIEILEFSSFVALTLSFKLGWVNLIEILEVSSFVSLTLLLNLE